MGSSGNGQESKWWPAERTAELVTDWLTHSATVLAARWDISRNAVIGKANRLCLPTKKQPPRVKPPPRPPRQFHPKPVVHYVEPPVPIPELPFCNLSLGELRSDQCHYPSGDYAPFVFCGQLSQRGSSFCPYHHRLVYRPVIPSVRDRYNGFEVWRGVR